MILVDLLSNIKEQPDDCFVGVRRPWTPSSEAVLVPIPPDMRFPAEARAQGFEYFLEVSIINEILADFSNSEPSAGQRAAFVIYYAENDAFPESV